METDHPIILESSGVRRGSGDLPAPLRAYVHEYYEEVIDVPDGLRVRLPVWLGPATP